jgi:hypothetical protein
MTLFKQARNGKEIGGYGMFIAVVFFLVSLADTRDFNSKGGPTGIHVILYHSNVAIRASRALERLSKGTNSLAWKSTWQRVEEGLV